MEAIRQRSRGLRLKHIQVDADEELPLYQLVEEAKEYDAIVIFLYKGIWVSVNPNTETRVIVEGWEIEWRRKLTEPRFRLVCSDGEEL